jgi:GT2 family glycosyltransferase
MKFSFVIPTYNNYGLLHQSLWDIYQKCSPVHEVIVVDDCSTDLEVQTGLNWWKGQDLLPIRHVRLNKNVMFLKASNVGLKLADGDIVCLLSNDVRLHKDIVGHMTNMFAAHDNLLMGGRYLNFDTGWNTFGSAIFPYLEGWLLATIKSGWKELDYFDDQFVPSDMEDVDLSAKARMLGYHLISLPEDMTTHIGGQSIGFNPEREAITIANKEKFRKKWIEIDEQ